jgi:HK97 family phage major capsid protein
MQTTSTTTTPETEFTSIMAEVQTSWPEFKSLPATVRTLQSDHAHLADQLTETRRLLASRSHAPTLHARTSPPGHVTDDCAAHIMAQFIQQCQKSNRLEALCSVNTQRDLLADFARRTLDLTTRAALTTTEIPLPLQYAGEIRELISQFGVVRKHMSHYPIGMGTAKPARMGTRPAFGCVAMSAALPDKVPSISFASLESHKIGGLVRLPREIDEQSIVPMGHFLARYGAIEFARYEDTMGFLADGNPGFDTVKGIVQVAKESTNTITLGAGKIKPSDATLADFRTLRTKVNKAALSARLSAYYLDSTWETALPGFKTQAEPNVYQRLPDGTAILDGYPIVWTDVLQPYGTTAAVSSPLAVFGALSYWWFGEHGHPRIDTSDHVLFVNDQLAVKFIEEIDFDYAATDATAALLTAAS